MSKYKFVLIEAGVRELLNSDAMKQLVEEKGKQLASYLGDGYEYQVSKGRSRWQCTVRTATYEAYFTNKKENTLLKGLGALRKG